MLKELQFYQEVSSCEQSITTPIYGVRVGTAVFDNSANQLIVDFADNSYGPLHARIALPSDELRQIKDQDGNLQVLLAFENGDAHRPIITGLLREQTKTLLDLKLNKENLDDIIVDGGRFVFDAKEEIVLRCGKSSVTLKKNGKIIIRGSDLMSRSSGGNRIKGASVNIN